MAEISFQSTVGRIFLAGLLILYAPQPSTFHEIDRRSIPGDSIHPNLRDYVSAKTARPRISRGRRQINSSSEEDDEDVSHTMWLSRHLSKPRIPDPHGAGPSSRPDQDEFPVVTKRRRLDTPAKPADNTVIRLFLDSSNLTNYERRKLYALIKRKVPDTTRIQLIALMRGLTGNATWSYEERKYFLNGFLQDPPEGWNQHMREEFLRIYFRSVYPGWSWNQQEYVLMHLLNPPPKGFNAEDRRYYLEYFWSEHPWCWRDSVRYVFVRLFYDYLPRGQARVYGALLDAFIEAPMECWTKKQRERFVLGFLQGSPDGLDERQRLVFLHNFANTPPMNEYIYFHGGNYHFNRTQNVSSTLPPKEYRRPSYDSI